MWSTSSNPYSSTLKQTNQIDWTIEDYRSWSAGMRDGSSQLSPVFDFYFPEVGKRYFFRLEICPKGDNEDEAYKDLGIYLVSLNQRKVDVNAEIRIGSEKSSFCHSFEAIEGFGFPSFLTPAWVLSNLTDDGKL